MKRLSKNQIREMERVVVEYDINDTEDFINTYLELKKYYEWISFEIIGKSFEWGDMNGISLDISSVTLTKTYIEKNKLKVIDEEYERLRELI